MLGRLNFIDPEEIPRERKGRQNRRGSAIRESGRSWRWEHHECDVRNARLTRTRNALYFTVDDDLVLYEKSDGPIYAASR